MRSATVVGAFVVLVCLCIQAKAESRYVPDCPTDKELLPKKITGPNCTGITCNKDGTAFGVGCGTFGCPDGERPVVEYDYSKPYPKCCPPFNCVPREPAS